MKIRFTLSKKSDKIGFNMYKKLIQARDRGQITLPAKIRRDLNIKSGQWLMIKVNDQDELVLKAVDLDEKNQDKMKTIEELSGILELGPSFSPEKINQQLDERYE